MVALPVMFRINGVQVPALQSIDTLTDIDHRGKGLFIKLALRLYKEAAASGFALIYGFPNENSAPGFFKKLNWISFGEAPFLFKPLNPFYFIKKLVHRKKHTDFSSTNYIFNAPKSFSPVSGAVIKSVDHFGDDYNRLWQLAAENIKVCIDRSAAYMNWRYVDKPGEHYYRYGLYVKDTLAAVMIFSIKNKHDGVIGYIMDLIIDPADVAPGKHLLKFASQLFKKHKVDVVLTWNLPGSFNHSCYKQSGYLRLPEKLRPQKLFIGAMALDRARAGLVEDIKNWYISYADSDTA